MTSRCLLILPSLLLVALPIVGGCAAESAFEPRPISFEPRDSEPAAPTPSGGANAGGTFPTGPLSLREALAAALLHNPRLQAASYGPRVAEARILQAGQRPNPEVEFGVEGFGGDGELEGFGGAETTLSLGQTIELGGKRQRRVEAAEAGLSVARTEYEAARLEVMTETTLLYVAAVELRRRIEVAEGVLALAEEAADVARRRVEAGDVAPTDRTRARLLTSSARIEVDRLRRRLVVARRELAAMWGATEPTFGPLTSGFDAVREVPALAELDARLDDHPRLRLAAAEVERLRAVADLERSRGVPDVTVGAGVQYKGEVDEPGLVAGVSIPLPLFDRNQGNALAARLEAVRAVSDRQATRVELSTRLARAHGDLEVAYHEARAVESDLLPAAEQAFDAVRRAYGEGKEPYLAVLEAQRSLTEARARLVEAVSDYHRARAEVEGLVAAPLDGSLDDPLPTTSPAVPTSSTQGNRP